MSIKVNYVGRKYGRLTVIEYYGKAKDGSALWRCLCDCGGEKIARGSNLNKGFTQSCGCLQKEYRGKPKKTTNGEAISHTRIYRIWKGIKNRCYNPKANNYKYYGGRGIAVCEEWLNDFIAFYNWAKANGYNDNLTIDRINTNGNYEPLNCRWADTKTQYDNRRNTKLLNKIKEVEEKYNITQDEIYKMFSEFLEKQFNTERNKGRVQQWQ